MPDEDNNFNENANNVSDDMLKTLNNDGKPPETRIGDGDQAYQIWQRLWVADGDRAIRRTRVKGLVDGNPPYNPADLEAAGQAYRCNVNFGTAKAYLDNAAGAFYDLFNEAPTYATFRTKKGTPDDIDKNSRSVTEHFDWLLRYEPRLDYNMQISQGEMTLYATGPLVFNDEFDWCPRSVLAGSLKVPEFTKSDTNYWELATVEVEYNADELWRKIQDETAAKAAGWNVSAVKQAIMNASPMFNQGGLYRTWEWHQQQLKNGSLYYSQTSKVIMVVQIFFQEFSKDGNKPGRISQVIINRDQAAQKGGSVFLYQKVGRYASWTECIHPMYYDRGGGGFHHSVTGLGVKMFPALTFVNRLRCANADKAFAPKIMLKAMNATATDEAGLTEMGDYLLVNENFEVSQLPVQSMLEDGMVFDRFIGNELNANLSQYRKSGEGDEPKSHVTATKTKYDAANEARLAKTQNVRYYMQLDALYTEMFKRAVYQGKNKVGFGWERCAEFIDRCKRAGVPMDCLDPDNIEYVKATRVIGQGSEFMRQQSLEFLLGSIFPMLPEGGRFKMIQDVIASRAGQSAVERYAPIDENPLPDNQFAWATSQIADMKTGVPAVITDSQNPAVFASAFTDAANKAIQSLEQGANPADVLAFLELAGQAIAGQIQRMAQDPSRKDLVKQLSNQLKQIGSVTDKLTQQLQEQQQMQQEEQMRMQQAQQEQMSDQALKWQKLQGDLQMKQAKTQFGMQEKAMKTRQALTLKDVTTAQELRNRQAAHEQEMREMRMNGASKEE